MKTVSKRLVKREELREKGQFWTPDWVAEAMVAYLGRRNARFIRNEAGVLPLTGFLCVYPHQTECEFVDRLWKVLCHLQTVSNLSLVGKSDGSGAVKVEPRALERLPLPLSVVLEAGLSPARSVQLGLSYISPSPEA